jgi:hypothetical protein
MWEVAMRETAKLEVADEDRIGRGEERPSKCRVGAGADAGEHVVQHVNAFKDDVLGKNVVEHGV